MAQGSGPAAGEPIAAEPIGTDVEETASAVRRAISEDWAATIIGLVLLGLALGGVITKGLIP